MFSYEVVFDAEFFMLLNVNMLYLFRTRTAVSFWFVGMYAEVVSFIKKPNDRAKMRGSSDPIAVHLNLHLIKLCKYISASLHWYRNLDIFCKSNRI